MSLLTNRKIRLSLLPLLIAVPLLLLSAMPTSGGEEEDLKIGQKLPLADQLMTATDGTSQALSAYAGKNGLIVVFSCNTCPFVVGNEDFPGWERQYNALSEKANAHGIGFVLVNANEAKRNGDDSMDAMIQRAAEQAYRMPYLLDKDHQLADAVGARTTPHVYAFDKELRLVYKGSIDNSWDSKREQDEYYLGAVIEHLDGGIKLRTQSTPPRGCSIKRITK